MTTTYQPPTRPQTHAWRFAIAWWRTVPQHERLALRRRGLRSAAAIVDYFWSKR